LRLALYLAYARDVEAEAVEAVKFCGSKSTLKKETESGSELGSI